ncbi:MAG: PDZ domain-containing protein [Gammaproteobacteria bacterium]
MRFTRHFIRLVVAVAALGTLGMAHAAEKALPRYPTIHGNTVVFEAAGDLWQVDRNGGTAERLTTDRGMDLMPRFSPDGKWIAFTGQYDGNTDVYVIPAGGGKARRLTYHSDVVDDAPLRWGPDNMVVTWTPDSKSIVFLSRRNTINSWFGRLFKVPVEGGMPEQLPLPKGGMTSFNKDGSKIVYNRIFRNFRTWKKYHGGMAQDVWMYDFDKKLSERLTDWKGTDTDPMWYGDTVYFASDRGPDQRVNIWAYDMKSKQFRQITHFDKYDVDWPSLGDSGITFQNGGDLYVIDLPSEKLHKLDVDVPADGVYTRERWVDASKLIQSAAVAPNGKRAVIGARGDIFTLPEKHGNTRDLTRTSGAREQYPSWSPDGKWVAYATDVNGESQIAVRPADGSGKERIVTNFKHGYLYQPRWSPDSKKLAVGDGNHNLWWIDIQDAEAHKIDNDAYSEIHDYDWSPDAEWIAYSKTGKNQMNSIYLFSLDTDKATRVSNTMNHDFEPTFGPDGKYLFFLSARHENPIFSQSEFNIATQKMTGIYVTTLRKGLASPFAPRSDEGTPDNADKSKPGNGAWKPGAIEQFDIDLEGLADRAVKLPVPSGNYRNLATASGRVYYTSSPVFTIGGELPGETPDLHVFDMDKREDKTLVSKVRDYDLAADGKKVLYMQPGEDGKPVIFIGSAMPDAKPEDASRIDLSHMNIQVDPVAEWNEMFHQAWRLERDLFFNEKMNGKDWTAVRDKYAALLPRMASREDLNYLIGEMIGELQNSHTYVGGGDRFSNDSVRTGLLGVDFGLDKDSGRYFLKTIYPGDNTRDDFRSPLAEPGVKAKEGDYVLAINGRELKAPTNPYSLLVGTLGEQVTLTLADNASGRNRHDVTVEPIKDELQLRLHAWIRHNREYVSKQSDGKVGYLYLSDMSVDGMNQFIRQFYPQIDKKGLIVDVRWNGGGFIDQILLERLRRVLIGMETNRERIAGTIPQQVLHGHMVCLDNHYSASDGDIFPWFFKKYQLGPVIGERTWGGVRGIRGEWELLDGGYITIPEFSLYGLDSQWIIENHGVEPDMEVDNLPEDVMQGRDPQLDAGLKYIMDKLKTQPMPIPQPPNLLPAYPPQHD